MSQDEGRPAVVIDNGMGTCIAGLSGETTPTFTLQTAIGYLPSKENRNERYLPVFPEAKNKPLSVGNAIKSNTDLHGQIFFEKFGVPEFHVVVDTVLALQGSGMRSALVLDCGEGVSSVGAMYEGCLIPHSVTRLDVAGTDVTTYLCHLLGQNGYKFTRAGNITISEREIVNTVKEKLGRIAEGPVGESGTRNDDELYVLPDGTQLRIGNERYECGEPLFNPSLIEHNQPAFGHNVVLQGDSDGEAHFLFSTLDYPGVVIKRQLKGLDVPGIQKLVIDSINRCDVDTRRDLYKDIILVGGTTQMKGFEERLRYELQLLGPDNVKINITAPSKRQHTVWLGGAMLASSAAFQEMWISKQEYQEHGLNIINKRCWACT